MDKKQEGKKGFRRPPIVTVMGHVDHGKTSLLDAIRNTNVTSSEFGGITQHVSAYQVTHDKKKITFIDTPGHEAFAQMRSRGGKIADIVILVVAGNEGVKQQTIEAINHAKVAEVPIIVAINKMDLSSFSAEKVKKQLFDAGVNLEDFGGDVVALEVSAKKKTNLKNLLDVASLISEMIDLNSDPDGDFLGVVLESRADRRKGVVVSAVVKNGTLKVGDVIYAQGLKCKVKSLTLSCGTRVKEAHPSTPVDILGFKELPPAGSVISASKSAGDFSEGVEDKGAEKTKSKGLGVIIKADTQGTLEAIASSIEKLKTEEAEVSIVHKGVGEVNQSDVLLASASKAIVIAFNAPIPSNVEFLAKSSGVLVRRYTIIYKLLEELEGALQGVLELEEEKIKGRAEVVAVFTLPSGDIVAGCNVFAGSFKVGSKVSLWESEEVLKKYLENPENPPVEPLFDTRIKKIKLEKDFVDIAKSGKNYGFLFDPMYKSIKEGNVVERL